MFQNAFLNIPFYVLSFSSLSSQVVYVRFGDGFQPSLDQCVEDAHHAFAGFVLFNCWVEFSDGEDAVTLLLNKVQNDVLHLFL